MLQRINTYKQLLNLKGMGNEDRFMHEHLAYLRLDEIGVSSKHRKTDFALFSLDVREKEMDFLDNFSTPEALGRFLAEKVYLGAVERKPFFSEGLWLIRFENSEDFKRLSASGTNSSIIYHGYPRMGVNREAISISGAVSESDDFFKIARGYREKFSTLI